MGLSPPFAKSGVGGVTPSLEEPLEIAQSPDTNSRTAEKGRPSLSKEFPGF